MSLAEVDLLGRLMDGVHISLCIVSVNAAYKPIGGKIILVAEELPLDAYERIERACAEPRPPPAGSIRHTFINETLAKLQIGRDGLLSSAEITLFCETIRTLGSAFTFMDDEIRSVNL